MPSRNRHREAQRRGASPLARGRASARSGEERRAAPGGAHRTPSGEPGPAASGSAVAPPAAPPRRITSADEAAALADHLLDPNRSRPVVVVSIPRGETEPRIDADAIADTVQELAEVVVLPTDASSWRFSEKMPEMTQVYGGAGRAYPVDLGWTHSPYASPLRFAYDASEGERATDMLISDALRMAHDAGLVTPERTPTIAASGVVIGVLAPSRAMVRLDDGAVATVWQELTAPAVPVERLLTPGMAVRGELDPESHRLDVTSMLRTGRDAIAHYRPDDVVLALVRQVHPDVVHLALHPGVVVPVSRSRVTGNPQDSLDDLFSVDEVVVARVDRVGPGGLTLRLDDIDEDEEPVAAPALLDDGPPWLEPPRVPDAAGPGEPEPAPASTSPVPAAAATPSAAPTAPVLRGAARDLSLTLDTARAEIVRLERDLAEATARASAAERETADLNRDAQRREDEVQRLREQIARQKTQLRKRVQSAGKAKRAAAHAAVTGEPESVDPERQFRLDVYHAWLARYSLAEREERPLAPYRLGPEFLATLDTTEGIARSKVLDVVVEVLNGLADRLASRERHPLRTGPGGGDPQRQRDDGALAWRVSLQQGVPSARRLHYWQLGEVVELSRVVLHDDTRP